MEHIVQFAVGIDDDAIRKYCEESAVKQIVKDVMDFSHGKDKWSGKVNPNPENLKDLFVDEIRKYVNEHVDEVLQSAVQEVAKGITRSKKFKEATDTVVNEIKGN